MTSNMAPEPYRQPGAEEVNALLRRADRRPLRGYGGRVVTLAPATLG